MFMVRQFSEREAEVWDWIMDIMAIGGAYDDDDEGVGGSEEVGDGWYVDEM